MRIPMKPASHSEVILPLALLHADYKNYFTAVAGLMQESGSF